MISLLTKLTGNLIRFSVPKFAPVSSVLPFSQSLLLKPYPLHNLEQLRSITKFSLRTGKRKSCKIVLKKFFRLHWGCWIRAKCGRSRKIYQKQQRQRRILRQHVLTNSTQSALLDKMVTKFWRKPKYYLDDPYQPYHSREEYFATYKIPK